MCGHLPGSTCLAAPGTSTRPQEPSSAPTSQTKRRTLVVYGRDPFRECFAKFLWKQNDYVSADQPASTTNSFFPYRHFHSSVQGAAGLKNRWGPLEGTSLWSLQCLWNTVLAPSPPCCPSGNSVEEDAAGLPTAGVGTQERRILWAFPVCRRCCCRAGTPQTCVCQPICSCPKEGSQSWQPSPVAGWCFSPPKAALSSPEYCPPQEEF